MSNTNIYAIKGFSKVAHTGVSKNMDTLDQENDLYKSCWGHRRAWKFSSRSFEGQLRTAIFDAEKRIKSV